MNNAHRIAARNSTIRLVVVLVWVAAFVASCCVILGYCDVRCHEIGGEMLTGQSGLVECVQR